MKNVLNIEKNIGITTFLTQTKGVGGKLRTTPEDFIVKEISNYPPEKKDGIFSIADVTSINWENNQLVNEISDRLHISRKRINFAGTKDKRAKTTQLMSFYRVPVEKIAEIKMPDLNTADMEKAKEIIKGTARQMGIEYD